MKKLNWIFFFAALVTGFTTNGQSTIDPEVPGDNFSLEGALEVFKKSASPEEFERLLNSPDTKVNNLDLNNDGSIDYIKVIDRNEGNVHAFIIQAVISETEVQDVAVIELQKLADGKAVLQITGDADVYGVETIIEPSEEVRVNAGASTVRTVVNVWAWPSVQYVYSPYYSPWVSTWSWGFHPIWWRPWNPVAFYVYSPWWRPYRPYYSFCYSHRIGYLPYLYQPYRRTSVYVYNNYHNQINQYRSHYDGRTRYEGRSSNGRDRYEGYGGRTRSDYHHRDYSDNGRYASTTNRTHGNYGNNMNRTQNDYNNNNSDHNRNHINRQSDYYNRSTTHNRSSADFRNTHEQGNSNYQQRNVPMQRSFNQSQYQRQSFSQSNRGNSIHRSSPSVGGSSMPRPSGGGGNSGGSHGGGGGHGGGGNHGGNHGGGNGNRGRH